MTVTALSDRRKKHSNFRVRSLCVHGRCLLVYSRLLFTSFTLPGASLHYIRSWHEVFVSLFKRRSTCFDGRASRASGQNRNAFCHNAVRMTADIHTTTNYKYGQTDHVHPSPPSNQRCWRQRSTSCSFAFSRVWFGPLAM